MNTKELFKFYSEYGSFPRILVYMEDKEDWREYYWGVVTNIRISKGDITITLRMRETGLFEEFTSNDSSIFEKLKIRD